MCGTVKVLLFMGCTTFRGFCCSLKPRKIKIQRNTILSLIWSIQFNETFHKFKNPQNKIFCANHENWCPRIKKTFTVSFKKTF